MSYTPRHASPKERPLARRAAGLAVAGAATLGTATIAAPSANAAGNVWDRVAKCESGGNWKINTGNGYYGGLQFSYGTWRAYGGGKYAKTANRASKAQQIAIAKKVLRAQGPGAWPVCSKRAGLTRANGLAAGGGGSAATPRPSRSNTRGKLVVDGVRGPLTNRAIERWVGGSVNGHLSSGDIAHLERKVGGDRDGRMERADVRKMQRKVGAHVDGAWGRQTTKALQRYLNAR